MIITFSGIEIRNDQEIYWFDVKIPEYRWTSFCVGIPERGPVSDSATVKELSEEQQDLIISECRKMADKMRSAVKKA